MSLALPGNDDNPPVDDSPAPESAAGDDTTDLGELRPPRSEMPAGSAGRAMRYRVATQGRRIRTLSVTALVNIVVIAILAGALAFTLVHFNGSGDSSLRSSALAAAKTYGAELSTYDYKNLNGSGTPWAKAEAHATARFRKDFSSTSADLAKLLHQYNATATGKVIDAGIETLTSSKAVVLLFIDQSVTNTVQKPNAVTQPLRVRLTMLRQHGEWLIDNLAVPK